MEVWKRACPSPLLPPSLVSLALLLLVFFWPHPFCLDPARPGVPFISTKPKSRPGVPFISTFISAQVTGKPATARVSPENANTWLTVECGRATSSLIKRWAPRVRDVYLGCVVTCGACTGRHVVCGGQHSDAIKCRRNLGSLGRGSALRMTRGRRLRAERRARQGGAGASTLKPAVSVGRLDSHLRGAAAARAGTR